MIKSKELSTEVQLSEFADRYALFRASRGEESERKLFLRGFERLRSRQKVMSRLIDDGFENIELVGFGKVRVRIDDGIVDLEPVDGHESEVYLTREIIKDHTEYPVMVEN